jgi:hypothetical protein
MNLAIFTTSVRVNPGRRSEDSKLIVPVPALKSGFNYGG